MANIGYVQLSRVCNQTCRFCSNPDNGEILTRAQARPLLDDLVARGYFGVVLTGGEPTLCEDLPLVIEDARALGLHTRLITNGWKLADRAYAERVCGAGLNAVHVSIHSHRADVHDRITQTPDALARAHAALEHLGALGPHVHLNTVINAYNADHLDAAVAEHFTRFPFIEHQVWNNLDPRMNRASILKDTIPRLRAFELSLHRAMRWLDTHGKTFRVERVPLCYMAEYAHNSTETRKIVKGEERTVHFLDWKGTFVQTDWQWGHAKAAVCAACSLNDVCAGLWEAPQYYDLDELYPVFVDADAIRRRVLAGGDD